MHALPTLPPTHPPTHPPIHPSTTPLPSGTSVRANATRLAGRSGWVEVSWSGVPHPFFDDYIALYPADADPLATAPIKVRLWRGGGGG